MSNGDNTINTILYIDDEEKNLTSFKAVFRKEYQIYVAKSAQEGIEIMENNPIHLVITDQRMPNMTGVEFLERIVDKYPDVTRIILTGFSDVEAIIQAINKGRVFRYVTKPWRKDELKETIDNALEYHYLKAENHYLIESLRKTNQELDRFVYSAAHDLRAPVTSLMGLLNLAKDENNIEQIRKYLNLQEKTVGKLNHFIHEIIDYSRNNRMEIEPDMVDFQAFVEQILENYANYDCSPQVRKEITVQQDCIFYSDKNRLEIILNNLISNAIRFANLHLSESYIKIKVDVNPQEAWVCVEDNGMGIAEKHKNRVFDMFYRATDQKVGSGLGLFLVRETMEKLKGVIQMESELGQGTTFRLKIPNLYEG
ncbi:MAG: hybrid sensor histidine kinase/response regulator [Microscillaceae bacterium]|jgi:signal transduction histidine kinase|nr:hybrid sensor histidine kinase/response regulator [Microscillaceae bacterium]